MTEKDTLAKMRQAVFHWKRGARTGGDFALLFLAQLTPDRLSHLRIMLAKNYRQVIAELHKYVELAPKTVEGWGQMRIVDGGSFALPPDPAAAAHALQQRQQSQEEQIQRYRIGVETFRTYYSCLAGAASLDPRSLSATVLDLARTLYDQRTFENMPILADALMDAGCDSEQIIQHCQGPGPHGRGCWVVDLLLGKE